MNDLTKSAENQRAEWSQAAKTIDAALDDHRRRFGADPATTDADYARMEKGTAGFFKGIREEDRHRKLDRVLDYLSERRAGLAKAAKVKRKVEAMNAKTAKIRERTELLKAQADETEAAIAEAVAKQQIQSDAMRAFVQDASVKIAQMTERLELGQEQVRRSQAYQFNRVDDIARRERDEWAFKAATASDPDLRSAYLARAEGRSLDDDDV